MFFTLHTVLAPSALGLPHVHTQRCVIPLREMVVEAHHLHSVCTQSSIFTDAEEGGKRGYVCAIV
jgi:hypothetical protein